MIEPVSRPKFEVVVSAATVEERRLVSAATVRTLTGMTEEDASDEVLNFLIDSVLTQCARSCKLATYRTLPVTLAQETVRATWNQTSWWFPYSRPPWPYWRLSKLVLPWRTPIKSVTVTEGDVELVEDVDYRLLESGVLERIEAPWVTSGPIVVDYVAGFIPLADYPEYQEEEEGPTLPPDLVMLISNQVNMVFDQRGQDFNVRSEDIPNVWSGAYNVPGGDAVRTDGLMKPLWEALAQYRGAPTVA